MIDELLATAWPEGVPQRLDGLIHRPLCAELIEDFKLGLVFPLDDESRPARVQLSDQGERARWVARVAERWPADALDPFVGRVPEHTRLMVDTDGGERAVVYLDDLQQVDHGMSAPGGFELMCVTLELPSGAQDLLTRHGEPPLDRLPRSIGAWIEHLVLQGAVGVWAPRWQQGQITSTLWITESRWRGNTATTRAIARSLGRHSGYDAALELLQSHGLEGYPDAIELHADGRTDLTLGILKGRTRAAETRGGEANC